MSISSNAKRIILMVALAVALCVLLVLLINYVEKFSRDEKGIADSESRYAELANSVAAPAESAEPSAPERQQEQSESRSEESNAVSDTEESAEASSESENGISFDPMADFTEKDLVSAPLQINLLMLPILNHDYTGWLYIPEVLSYPVVNAERTDQYIDTDFFGKESKSGTLFRYPSVECDKADVLTIYGHTMRKGAVMFSGLKNYKKETYASEHSVAYYYMPGGNTVVKYRLYAVIDLLATENVAFARDRFASETDRANYAQEMRGLSLREYADYAEGARFLALSTCDTEYDKEEGRLVVIFIEEKIR